MTRSAKLGTFSLSVALIASVLLLPPLAAAQVTHDEPPAGAAPGTGSPASKGSRTGDGVLIVGDSLEVLTGPYLRRHLRGLPVTVNAVGGYNSYQIFDLFRESYKPSHSVIVFDAGTNDNPAYPQILAGNLKAVAEAVGDRCMVVPSIHGLTVNGIDSKGKNRAVYAFAASRPGTQVPDWARTVAKHPELMQPDDLHPTPEGADYRARQIASGVANCIASATPDFVKPNPGAQPVERLGLWSRFVSVISAWADHARSTLRQLLEPLAPVP